MLFTDCRLPTNDRSCRLQRSFIAPYQLKAEINQAGHIPINFYQLVIADDCMFIRKCISIISRVICKNDLKK